MAILVLSAFLIDLLIGDPKYSMHPVRLIGSLSEALESILRRQPCSPFLDYVRGTVLVILVVSFCFGLPYLMIYAAKLVHPILGSLAAVFIIYSSLAFRDLQSHALDVTRAIENYDLRGARTCLARIVGRDTADLSAEQVLTASVESIAENTVDAIIAPIFYAFIGGAPLAFAYRAVNTLDSMIGYKNPKYLYFGWAAAKLDDVFNYIPARINTMLVPLAGLVTGHNPKEAVAASIADGRKHLSPNSGLSEAAFAGALGIQLGGECTYRGEKQYRPLLGKPLNPVRPAHVHRSIRICLAASIIMLTSAIIISVLTGGLN
jgi:adenosylcobinamide-phosphate synthase